MISKYKQQLHTKTRKFKGKFWIEGICWHIAPNKHGTCDNSKINRKGEVTIHSGTTSTWFVYHFIKWLDSFHSQIRITYFEVNWVAVVLCLLCMLYQHLYLCFYLMTPPYSFLPLKQFQSKSSRLNIKYALISNS